MYAKMGERYTFVTEEAINLLVDKPVPEKQHTL